MGLEMAFAAYSLRDILSRESSNAVLKRSMLGAVEAPENTSQTLLLIQTPAPDDRMRVGLLIASTLAILAFLTGSLVRRLRSEKIFYSLTHVVCNSLALLAALACLGFNIVLFAFAPEYELTIVILDWVCCAWICV